MHGKSYPVHINRIPEVIELLKGHIDRDFWTILLAQGKNLPLPRHHPWVYPYYQFTKKNKVNLEVIKMASEMLSLAEFEAYWTDSAITKQVVAKIKNPKEFKSLMFEFRVAFHFKKCLGYRVELSSIPLSGDRIGDMRVILADELVEVECSGKRDKPERNEFHLANYLHKEAIQLSGRHPSIIAIHVPERRDWELIAENNELAEHVTWEFRKPKFDHVSAVCFSCDQEPSHKFNTEHFRESYDTSITMLYFVNHSAKLKLPIWFSIT